MNPEAKVSGAPAHSLGISVWLSRWVQHPKQWAELAEKLDSFFQYTQRMLNKFRPHFATLRESGRHERQPLERGGINLGSHS